MHKIHFQRAELLKKLAQVQATPEEMQSLTSIAATQTKGLKKLFTEKKILKTGNDHKTKTFTLNSIKGAKKLRSKWLVEEKKEIRNNDPNVVGFESSDYSSSDSDESDDNEGQEEGKNIAENREANVTSKGEKDVEFKVTKTNEKEKINEDTKPIISKQEVNVTSKGEKNMEVEVTGNNTRNNEIKIEKENINKDQHIPIVRKPAVFVEVERSAKIQAARLKLPILAEEQEIMEVINENSVIIIAGETGKTFIINCTTVNFTSKLKRRKRFKIFEPF